MADTKISALPASTTPLAGTEVLPIVQSGTTKQVSIANLTAGRAVSAQSFVVDFGNYAGVGARFQYNSSNVPFCINALNNAGDAYISWNAAAKSGSNTATRVIAGYATKIEGGGGQIIIYRATSSTAGSDISWSESLRIDNSGYLGLGGTPSAAAVFGGTVLYIEGALSGTLKLKRTAATSATCEIGVGNGYLGFAADGSNVGMKLDSTTNDFTLNLGNLVLGTAGKSIKDSTGTVSATFSSTSVSVNAALSGGIVHRAGTYTAGATTPSVAGISFMVIANTGSTTITNFTGGVTGQQLILFFNDANTTITRNNALLLSSANFVSTQYSVLTLVYNGNWVEVSRSGTIG